jgi:hypothetical protein
MKKLVEKFKSQPLPIKLGAMIGLLWIIPFIESIFFEYGGWYDLPIHDLILVGLGCLIFAFGFIKFFVIPVGYWIGLGGKWVISKFKKGK